MTPQTKKRLKQLRRFRIRKKLSGTSARPRMVTTFSNTHIYVQFIDDIARKTLASASMQRWFWSGVPTEIRTHAGSP